MQPNTQTYLRQDVPDDDDQDRGGEEAHEAARQVGHEDGDEHVHGHVPEQLAGGILVE